MKTKWHLCILWSVLSLGLLSSAADAYESSPALRKKKIFKLGTQKSKPDAIKLPTSGDAKSSRRLPDSTSASSRPGSQPQSAPERFYQPRTPVLPRSGSPGKPETNIQSDFAYLPDVSVTCAASDFVVRVKPAFYGLGAHARELKLGNTCKSNGVLKPYGDLLFTYPLTACDAQRELLFGYLVYKFVLHYEPSSRRFPSRAHKISVDIECRYQWNHHVYQLAVQPTWQTAVVHKTLKGHLNDFQIELMDESWSGPVKSRVFQLGQTVNVQVSASHQPTGGKLYINSCYATPSTGSKSSLKFAIIDNFGCLLDSRTDPGASGFISRTDKILRFSLKAFQFTPDTDAEISIKCQLLVTSADPGPAHKSCTYRHDRWEALSGDDSICGCCDSQCVTSKPRRAMIEGSASGSLLVSDELHITEDNLLPISPSLVNTRGADETTVTRDFDELHGHDNQWQSVTEYDKSEREKSPEAEEEMHREVILDATAKPEPERFGFRDGFVFEERKAFEVEGSNEFGEDGSRFEGDFSGNDKEEEKGKGREDEISDLKVVHLHCKKDGTTHHWVQFEQKPELEAEEENRENGDGSVKDEVQWKSGDGLVDVIDEKEMTWYFTWT